MCRDAACSVRFFTTEFTEFHGVFIFCHSEHSSFCHPEELLATKDLDNTAQPNMRMSTEFLFLEGVSLPSREGAGGV